MKSSRRLFGAVVFAAIGALSSLLYAEEVEDPPSTIASADVSGLLQNAETLTPGESAPPPETAAVTDISVARETVDAPEMGTPDPEPLTPAEGIALRSRADGPIPSVEILAGDNRMPSTNRIFHYGVSLELRGVYDDNINLSSSNKVSGYYLAIEPALAFGFGDVVGRQRNYIRVDYAPSVLLFDDDAARDGVQHVIRLEAQYRTSRFTFQLTQDVQFLRNGTDGPNISSTVGPGDISNSVNLDVAGRVQVDIYRTHIGASYDLTSKTFLSSSLEYSVYDYGSLISSERLLGNLFINYRYSPKLVIGIGGGGGYQWVDEPNPNQTFEQANLRTTYQATGKISLYAEAGVEFRQFENDSRDDYITPVYELGATYRPFDGTTITLRGNRRIQSSAALAGQDFTLTNIILALRQRLFHRVYLGLTGGYEHAEYFSTIANVHATREDDFFMIEPSIDILLAKFWTIGAYYLHRENNSSLNGFGFDANQVGVRTKITF